MKGIFFKQGKLALIRQSPPDRIWVTRRLMNPQPNWEECPICHRWLKLGTVTGGDPDDRRCIDCFFGSPMEYWVTSKVCGHLHVSDHQPCEICRQGKPRYRPGEVVFCREAWAVNPTNDHLKPSEISSVAFVTYLNNKYNVLLVGRHRSPLFMPEWAARTHILILTAKPEILRLPLPPNEMEREGGEQALDLLQRINNMWCWRYELRRVEFPPSPVAGKERE